MKDYVYIQSNINIMVTAGLQNDDVTNSDAHVPDRLKISPVWTKMRIMIETGRHIYPSFITEWNSVKALVKDSIITIGEEVDTCNNEQVVEKANDIKEEITKRKSSKTKEVSLDEVAE